VSFRAGTVVVVAGAVLAVVDVPATEVVDLFGDAVFEPLELHALAAIANTETAIVSGNLTRAFTRIPRR
jgi:hypothetical protein